MSLTTSHHFYQHKIHLEKNEVIQQLYALSKGQLLALPYNCSVLNSSPISSRRSCLLQRWTEWQLWMLKWWACQTPRPHSGQNWKALPGQNQALDGRKSCGDGQKLGREKTKLKTAMRTKTRSRK